MFKPLGLLLILFPILVSAFPKEPIILNGGAALQEKGDTLYIEATAGAIIEWSDFSIGKGETVSIDVDGCISCRVGSGNPIRIEGKLISKGKVLLIDPDGFYIDPMAFICCSDFIISTTEPSSEEISSLGPVKLIGEKKLSDNEKLVYAINLSKGKVWFD